jgi:hypothetical protein
MVKKHVNKSLALVKRTKPATQGSVENQLADLLSADNAAPVTGRSSSVGGDATGFMSKYREPKAASATKKKSHKSHSLQVVGKDGIETVEAPAEIAKAAAAKAEEDKVVDPGLKLLRRAVRDQSHAREMPQHDRHDYEYLLRRVATAGVVQVFNALATAQNAGRNTLQTAEKTVTIDKAEEKKFVATRDAFLSSLRSTKPTRAQL